MEMWSFCLALSSATAEARVTARGVPVQDSHRLLLGSSSGLCHSSQQEVTMTPPTGKWRASYQAACSWSIARAPLHVRLPPCGWHAAFADLMLYTVLWSGAASTVALFFSAAFWQNLIGAL